MFNSSYFHTFDYELLPLFTYALWTSCGVPIPVQAMTATTTQPVPTTQPEVTTTLAPVAITTVGIPAVPTTDGDSTTTRMAADDDETTTGGVVTEGEISPTTRSVVGMEPTSSAIRQLKIAAIFIMICAMSAALIM